MSQDGFGSQPVFSGDKNTYNITASAVIKASAGRLVRVSVISAGVAGAVNDCNTVAAAAAGNQIGVIPAAIGVYYFDWPCTTGIVYILGAGQVIAVSYV